MAKFGDFLGIIGATFKLGLGSTAALLKSTSGTLVVRNAGDSADAPIVTSRLDNSGDSLILNSDAAGTGADRKITLARPTTGMSADYTFTFPTTPGTNSFILQTDGAGNTSWIANSGATNQTATDTTSVVFGSASPISAFTLPANARVQAVRVYVDTAFTGGTSPTLSVGISGTTSKYSAAQDLGTVGCFEYYPTLAAVGTTEAIIITYVSGGSTAGAARVETDYVIPS